MLSQVATLSRPSIEDPLGLFQPKSVSVAPQVVALKQVAVATAPARVNTVSQLGSRESFEGSLRRSLWQVAVYAEHKFAPVVEAQGRPFVASGLRQNLGDAPAQARSLMAALRQNLSSAYRELIRIGA